VFSPVQGFRKSLRRKRSGIGSKALQRCVQAGGQQTVLIQVGETTSFGEHLMVPLCALLDSREMTIAQGKGIVQ
jgi:hypothetical protein